MKAAIIDSIVDKLKGKGIAIQQPTIDYLFKKDVAFLKGVSRAINTKAGKELIELFA